jgi:hypothetical protein
LTTFVGFNANFLNLPKNDEAVGVGGGDMTDATVEA